MASPHSLDVSTFHSSTNRPGALHIIVDAEAVGDDANESDENSPALITPSITKLKEDPFSEEQHLTLTPVKGTQLTNQTSSFHRWSVAIVQKIKNQLDTETISMRTDIKYKLIFTILIATCGVSSAFMLRNHEQATYKFIAVSMAYILGLFFLNFLYFVFKSKALHRIEVITARIKPDFGNIIFPIKIKQYPYEPIKSMSELFALRGTSIHLTFGFVCNTIGVLIFLAVLINWFHLNLTSIDFVEDKWEATHIANFFGMCGGMATPLMGNYDLNPNDQGHIAMHYIGVILMGVSVWAIGIQSCWSLQSVILISITMVVLAVWVYLSTFHYPEKVEITQTVSKKRAKEITHRISLVCIVAETMGCICASACNILYVWNLGDVAVGTCR